MILPRHTPFGQIAVELGFASRAQVRRALEIQRRSPAERGNGRPLLGIVMVREGIISPGQLIRIVKLYHERRKSRLMRASRRMLTPDLLGAAPFIS